jgi:exonuclease III
VKGWKIYQPNGPRKQAGVAILILDKVDFKLTLIKRDKEGHAMLIKGEIHQKETTIINLSALNLNTPNFIKHILKDLKAYIVFNTVVVGDFNTPLLPIDRSSKQKINEEILELNHTIYLMDLVDVYRIFHPTSTQYTFFSAAHGIFSKIDYILGYKASLSKYKKIEIIPCILSDHNALKLDLNNKNNSRKHANIWKLNNTLLSDQWVIDEIKEKIKRLLEVNENENMIYQNLWDTAKAVLRGTFIAMSAYIKRTERSKINDLMLHIKLLEKEQAKPKKSRKELIKIRAKINEILTNKQKNQRITKTKSWFFEKINKIDRPLANLTKLRRQKTQISKIRNAIGEITTNTLEIQKVIRDYFENLYSNKFENLEEMDKFLDTYDHPKLNQEDINPLNRSITQNEIKAATESPKKEKSRT